MTEKSPINDAIVLDWLQKAKEPVTSEEVLLHVRIALGRYMPAYRDTLKDPGAYAADVDADRAVVVGILENLASRGVVSKVQNDSTMQKPVYSAKVTPETAAKAAEVNPMMEVDAVLRKAAKEFGPKLLRAQVNSTLSKIEFGEAP